MGWVSAGLADGADSATAGYVTLGDRVIGRDEERWSGLEAALGPSEVGRVRESLDSPQVVDGALEGRVLLECFFPPLVLLPLSWI